MQKGTNWHSCEIAIPLGNKLHSSAKSDLNGTHGISMIMFHIIPKAKAVGKSIRHKTTQYFLQYNAINLFEKICKIRRRNQWEECKFYAPTFMFWGLSSSHLKAPAFHLSDELACFSSCNLPKALSFVSQASSRMLSNLETIIVYFRSWLLAQSDGDCDCAVQNASVWAIGNWAIWTNLNRVEWSQLMKCV